MNIQSCHDETSRPISGRRFSIPKVQRAQSKGCRYPHDLKSQQAKEILALLTRPILDKHFRLEDSWHLTQVCTVQNEKLQERFVAKKQELKRELSKELQESYAFGIVQGDQEADCICGTGDFSKQLVNVPLGRVDQGVNVCSHPDILLQWADKKEVKQPCIIIYKILKGRCKTVPARTTAKDPTLDPTPHAECHIAYGYAASSEAIFKQLSKSQVFLFEYDEEALPSRQPRHCLPFATISLQSRKAEIHKMPNSSPGTLNDIRGAGEKTIIFHQSAVHTPPLDNHQASSARSLANEVPGDPVSVTFKAGTSQPLKRPLSQPSVEEVEAKYLKGRDKENYIHFNTDTSQSNNRAIKSCDAGRMKLSDRFSKFAASESEDCEEADSSKSSDSRLEELKTDYSRALQKLEAVRRARCNNMLGYGMASDEAKSSLMIPHSEDSQPEICTSEPRSITEMAFSKMKDYNDNDLCQPEMDKPKSFERLKITIDTGKSSDDDGESGTDRSGGLRELFSSRSGSHLQKEHEESPGWFRQSSNDENPSIKNCEDEPEFRRQMREEGLHSPRTHTAFRSARKPRGNNRIDVSSRGHAYSKGRGNHRGRNFHQGTIHKHSHPDERVNHHYSGHCDSYDKYSAESDSKAVRGSNSKRQSRNMREDRTLNAKGKTEDDKNEVPFVRLQSRNTEEPISTRIENTKPTDIHGVHAAIDSLSSYSETLKFEAVSADEEDQKNWDQPTSSHGISGDDMRAQDMEIDSSSADSGRGIPKDNHRKRRSHSARGFTYSYLKSLNFENVSSDEDEQNTVPPKSVAQNTSGDDMEVRDMEIEENSTDSSCNRDTGCMVEKSSSPSLIDPVSVQKAISLLEQQIQQANSQEQKEVYRIALKSFLQQLNSTEAGSTGKTGEGNQAPQAVVDESVQDGCSFCQRERNTDAKTAEGLSLDTMDQQRPSGGSVSHAQKQPKLMLFHGQPLITRHSKRTPRKILLETVPGTALPIDPRAALSHLFGRKSIGEIDLKMVSWKEGTCEPKEKNIQGDAPEVQENSKTERKGTTFCPRARDPRLLKPKPKRLSNTVQVDDPQVQSSSSKEECQMASVPCSKGWNQSSTVASSQGPANEVSSVVDTENLHSTPSKQDVTSSPSDFSSQFYQKVKEVIGMDLACAPTDPRSPKVEEEESPPSTPTVSTGHHPRETKVTPSEQDGSASIAEALGQSSHVGSTPTHTKAEKKIESVTENGSPSVSSTQSIPATGTVKKCLNEFDDFCVDVTSSFLEESKRSRRYSCSSSCSSRSSVSYLSEASQDSYGKSSEDSHYEKSSRVRSSHRLPPKRGSRRYESPPHSSRRSRWSRSPVDRRRKSSEWRKSPDEYESRSGTSRDEQGTCKKPCRRGIDDRRYSAPSRIETDPVIKDIDEKLSVLKFLTHNAIRCMSPSQTDKTTFKTACCNYIKIYNDMWCQLTSALLSLKHQRNQHGDLSDASVQTRIYDYELKAANIHVQLELLLGYTDQTDYDGMGVADWEDRPISGVTGLSVAEDLILLYRLKEEFSQQDNRHTADLLKLVQKKKEVLGRKMNSSPPQATSLPQQTSTVLTRQNYESTSMQGSGPWGYPIIRTVPFQESASWECWPREATATGPQLYNSTGLHQSQDIRKVVLTTRPEMSADPEHQRFASSNPAQPSTCTEYVQRNI